MRRMPIPVRINPFLPRGCPRGIYAGLARVSPGCPPDRGRLHTCYSPVRRSPAGSAGTPPAAPRLACVKPAASVHPEPGSNSPLLCIFSDSSFFQFVCPAVYLVSGYLDGKSCIFVSSYLVAASVRLTSPHGGVGKLVLWHHFIVLCAALCPELSPSVVSDSGCKITKLSPPSPNVSVS